jgi:DNA-binding MarR family transcriptional regulator
MDDPVDQTLFLETVHTFLSVYRYLRRYSRQMHEEGVSGRQISTLRYLLEAGPQTIGQLRDYLYLNDSTTSELVTNLEQAGHVARSRSGTDSRVVVVTLTPAGREVALKTPLQGLPLLREKLKALPPERLARVRDALAELQDLLEIPNDR